MFRSTRDDKRIGLHCATATSRPFATRWRPRTARASIWLSLLDDVLSVPRQAQDGRSLSISERVALMRQELSTCADRAGRPPPEADLRVAP